MNRFLLLVIPFIICISLSSLAQDQESGFKAYVILESTTTLGGNAISLPQGEKVEIEGHIVEIKPGAEVGRHKHPYPIFMYVLEGTLLVEMDDGTQKTYNAGEAFIEDADTMVNNSNPGTEPVKFLAVLPGFKDSPMVIMPEN